jgi:WD40 repeat protein
MMHRRSTWLALVVCSIACGDRYGATSTPPAPTPAADAEAQADAATLADGAPEPANTPSSCDSGDGFGLAELVPGLPPAAIGSAARLSPDELTVYVAFAGATSADLSFATRTSETGPFGPLQRISVSNNMDELDPWISADGLTMLFGRGTSTIEWNLFRTSRPTTAHDFENAAVLRGLDGTQNWAGYLRSDGSVLYFTSSRPGASGYDLYRASAKGEGFEPSRPLTELNTALNDETPVIAEDELTIYWASTRTDLGAKGKRDIYMASRRSATDPFSSIRNVAELNTSEADYPGWISRDQCRLYFTRDSAILVARRPARR